MAVKMPNDLAPLLARIHDLVGRSDGEAEPLLRTMEHTLTEGYAHALALEGERLRIEREIGELVARLEHGGQAGRLRALADRRAGTDRELTRLRVVLATLREKADLVRRSRPTKGSDEAAPNRVDRRLNTVLDL
jgi:hypothetical protein